MNAELRRPMIDPEPLQLGVPEAALMQLRLRLGRGLATGEAWDVACAYGVAPDELDELVEYWHSDFELDRQGLNELKYFSVGSADAAKLCFVHARSPEAWAMPLLLLHGYSGSLTEFQGIVPALVDPRAHGGAANEAFHVVCPALLGSEHSSPRSELRTIAESCAALMKQLGYQRYLVHGSDLGACVALELGALDSAHVAALHVTSLPAYPGEDPFELAALTSAEKSQLSRLGELHEQLSYQLPETPMEALALALSTLEEDSAGWREQLLTQLTLTWAFGTPYARNELQRQQRLAPAAACDVPIAVHCFPLDAPNLRRFAERRRRVVTWQEHERGGAMPALEQPAWLLSSLREHSMQLR